MKFSHELLWLGLWHGSIVLWIAFTECFEKFTSLRMGPFMHGVDGLWEGRWLFLRKTQEWVWRGQKGVTKKKITNQNREAQNKPHQDIRHWGNWPQLFRPNPLRSTLDWAPAWRFGWKWPRWLDGFQSRKVFGETVWRWHKASSLFGLEMYLQLPPTKVKRKQSNLILGLKNEEKTKENDM